MRVLPELQTRPKIGGVEPSHILGNSVIIPLIEFSLNNCN